MERRASRKAARHLSPPSIRPLQHFPHLVRIEAQRNLLAFHQNGPFNEIRIFGHQGDGFRARRRRLLHVLFAVKLIARIQEHLVIPVANQSIELFFGQAAIEIDLLEGRSGFTKKTLRVATGCSSRFQIKSHHTYLGTVTSISRLQRSIPPAFSSPCTRACSPSRA